MQERPVDVIVAAYKDPSGATESLDELVEARKAGLIRIKDAAVLTKDSNSRLNVVDINDKGFGKGALLGGVTGAVVGILAGPVGWATLGGVAIGGLAAKLRDGGFSDERLRSVGEGLQPNSSALIAIIEEDWTDDVARMIEDTGAEIVTDAIAMDVADQLEREVEEPDEQEHRRAV